MSAQLLLVEDSRPDQLLVQAALGQGTKVTVAASLAAARACFAADRFDLLLLDVDLPDGNGFRFFAELKAADATADLPVIFLTARSDPMDEVMGFSLGADDYVTKPVDPSKLRARVEAKLRKLEAHKASSMVLKNSGLRLEISFQRAFAVGKGADRPLELTPIEFKLLAFLMRQEEQVFSREQLMERVWGRDVNVIDRAVDMHASNLRKKIKGTGYTVEAVRGVGYRFVKSA